MHAADEQFEAPFPESPPLPGQRDETTLLTELAQGLAMYGAPAHRLQEAVSALAESLGVRAKFFAMPTAVFAMYERDDGTTETRLLPVESSEISLERLVGLDLVLNEVADGRYDAAEGVRKVRELLSAPSGFGPWTTVLSFGLVSATATRFFGGGWREMAAAALVGLIVGSLAVVAQQRRDLARVLEFVSGLVAATLAFVLAGHWPGLVEEIVILGGVIVLLPGLTLTMAVTELSTRNLVSGSTRLIGAIMILVSIGIGVALGRRLTGLIEPSAPGSVVPLPEWTLWLSLLLTPAALVVLFRGRWDHIWAIGVAAFAAFFGARWGTVILGTELGVGIGAFIVGVLGNVYARRWNRPAVVVAVPGILLLVPGGIGMKSVTAFTSQDALAGVGLAFTTLMVSVSLVAGLLLANVAAPPRKAL